MNRPIHFAFALLLLAAACGTAEEPSQLKNHIPLDLSAIDAVALTAGVSTNGLSTNGLSTNGLSTNGLSTNGLSTNGLSTNGLNAATLSSPLFGLWFSLSPSYSAMLMSYLVKCAYPTGQSLSYKYSGTSYSWPGDLGLAPSWASGGGMPLVEQQLISACLAAHTNKYGVHMDISVRGFLPNGSAIPVTSSEQATFTSDEGCFFGNLFDGSGVFSAWSANSPLGQHGKTSLRACAASDGQAASCSPMQSAGATCQAICTADTTMGASYFGMRKCTVNGKTYPALTTRLQPADVATCGDGICQASEVCYSLSKATGCRDCGTCK